MNNHTTLYKLAQAIHKVVDEFKLVKRFNPDYTLKDIDFYHLVQAKSEYIIGNHVAEDTFFEMVHMVNTAYINEIKNA